MQFKDYYKTLGLARDASQDEIKRAYRRLAHKYHPDVSKETDAEDRFKEVAEAYEVLKDPEKRAAYDRFGSDWRAGQEFHPPPDWDAGFEFRGGGGGPDLGGFSDFFESLFGQGGLGGMGGMGGMHRGFHSRSQDHHARVLIDLEDAYRGATRTITLERPEVNAQGQLVQRPHTLNVKIPRGVTAGQRIRLAGQGMEGGDLYLEVDFRPHPRYTVEGRDVTLTLPTTPWEAALGNTVTVPTLGGPVDLKIPAGSQSGRKLRLRGRGLPGKPPGDQYVVLQIVTPAPTTEEARHLYEQMARVMPMNPRAELGV